MHQTDGQFALRDGAGNLLGKFNDPEQAAAYVRGQFDVERIIIHKQIGEEGRTLRVTHKASGQTEVFTFKAELLK